MELRSLRTDERGLMMNIGIFMILGYLMMAFSGALYWMHNKDLFQEFFGGIWPWACIIFGLGLTIIVAHKLRDPIIVLGVFIVGTVLYYVMLVM
jgi:hypothetical protein